MISVARESSAPIFIATGFVAAALLLDALGMVPSGVRIVWYTGVLTKAGTACALVLLLLAAVRELRRSHRSLYQFSTWRIAVSETFSPRRVLNFVALVLLVPPFMSAFASLKQSIVQWNPFSWDARLHSLDVTLHRGQPWELLHGVLGIPAITTALDRIYYLWFPVVVVTVSAFAWSRDRHQRSQFFVAYFLCWSILGVAVAAVFSSAGPCYYAEVVAEPSPYEALLSYLRDVSDVRELTALRVQEYLWTGYATGGYSIEGIAAMPSLHVAMALLFFLATRRVSKLLSAAYFLFFLLILLGSVHLGWHYAIDGYVSALAVVFLWSVAGRTVRLLDDDADRDGPGSPPAGD